MSVNPTPYDAFNVVGDPEEQVDESVVASDASPSSGLLFPGGAIDDCERVCAPSCAQVFDRVQVYHAIRGGGRVEWELSSSFSDPAPYEFQLQVGRTASNDADDWTNIGSPVVNAFYSIDADQRVWGNVQWTHYRVKLTTVNGVYYSPPEPALGALSRIDWRRGREIRRKEELRFRKTPAGTEGYLLKRRIYGERCTCIDEMTHECRNPQHVDCYGTGILGGYFDAIGCSWVEFTLRQTRTHQDLSRGTVNDVAVPARMLYWPQPNSYDVWVNATSDERWIIHEVSSIAEIRGIPLVANVGLRLVPFGDIIYDIPVS